LSPYLKKEKALPKPGVGSKLKNECDLKIGGLWRHSDTALCQGRSARRQEAEGGASPIRKKNLVRSSRKKSN